MTDEFDFLRKLENSETLLNVLMSIEDFLDGLDIYGFKNWIKGEVIEGPLVERYWVSVALKYQHRDMPDPRAAERLIGRGVEVEYVRAKQELFTVDPEEEELIRTGQKAEANSSYGLPDKKAETKAEYIDIWIIVLKMPRRFIEDQIEADLEEFEQEDDVETEDVSDARDEGLDQEDAIKGDDETEEELDEE